MDDRLLVIDGSHGEGGGQILRIALSLAVLVQRPIRIERIRAGRPKPGLAAQHLTAVRALAALCDARVEGAELSSQRLDLYLARRPAPGTMRSMWRRRARGEVRAR